MLEVVIEVLVMEVDKMADEVTDMVTDMILAIGDTYNLHDSWRFACGNVLKWGLAKIRLNFMILKHIMTDDYKAPLLLKGPLLFVSPLNDFYAIMSGDPKKMFEGISDIGGNVNC